MLSSVITTLSPLNILDSPNSFTSERSIRLTIKSVFAVI